MLFIITEGTKTKYQFGVALVAHALKVSKDGTIIDHLYVTSQNNTFYFLVAKIVWQLDDGSILQCV